MERVEIFWEDLREFWEFSVWILNCDCSFQNSVTISALYHLLIHLLNMISKMEMG